MKLKRILSALAAFAIGSLPVLALDNEGLIKLKSAGFDDETILLKMDSEPAEYDLSTDGLIALKTAGISEAIIKKALTLDLGAAPAQNSTAQSQAPLTAKQSSTNFSRMDIPSIAVPEITPEVGGTYFTRIGLFHEGRKHLTTNYGRGIFIPVNTEVELVRYKKKTFIIRIVKTGEEIIIINEPKYTGRSVENVPALYLADQKTPIDQLSKDLQSAITSGTLRLGMTKEVAIATRGYPPVHATPSTNSDRWVYWSSRFVQLTIVFNNDRIVEGRGLY